MSILIFFYSMKIKNNLPKLNEKISLKYSYLYSISMFFKVMKTLLYK